MYIAILYMKSMYMYTSTQGGVSSFGLEFYSLNALG